MPTDDRMKWKRRRRRRNPRSSLGSLRHLLASALLVLICVVTVKSAPAARIRGTGVVGKRDRSLLSGPGEVVGGNGEWEDDDDDDDDDVETTVKSAASGSGANVTANAESAPTDGAWDEDDDEESTSTGESNNGENEAEVEAPFPPASAADANGPAAAEGSWEDDDDAGTNSDDGAVEHPEVEATVPQSKQLSHTTPIPGRGNGPAAAEDSWGDDDDAGINSGNEPVEHDAAATEEQLQMTQEGTKPTVPSADDTSDTLPSTIEPEGDADALKDAAQGVTSQTTTTNAVELSTAKVSDQALSMANDPAQSSAIDGDPNFVDGDYDKESDITLGGQATTSVHRNQSGDASFENNGIVANAVPEGISAEEQPAQVATEDQVSVQTGDQTTNQEPNGIPPNVANEWKGYGNEVDEEDESLLEMLSFTFNVILLAAFLTSILVIRRRVQDRLIADSTLDTSTAVREEVTTLVLSIAAWSAGSSGEGTGDNAIRNASSIAGTGQSSFGQETVPLSTAGTLCSYLCQLIQTMTLNTHSSPQLMKSGVGGTSPMNQMWNWRTAAQVAVTRKKTTTWRLQLQ